MPRVLIIEDDKYFRTLVRAMLADGGYDVVEAGDGEAGLAAYKNGAFDVVLVDLFMPEKDGFEVITELKRDFPAVRIIAMSGGRGQYGPKEEYLPIALRIGAANILTKPFTPETLLAAVARLLPPA